MTDKDADMWVFGYGSLIWRPDFPCLRQEPAWIKGWTRRFWQGSHDHRGVPEAPGRVVTLVPEDQAICGGMAWLVERNVVNEVFENLDYREKNGYERFDIALHQTDQIVQGVVYVAPIDNFAWLGEASIDEIATQIIASTGPSGRNRDYLFELAEALRKLDIDDAHVFQLEHRVRELLKSASTD